MAVLVSCQGASLNIRFVSAEGPWGGVDRVPFQSTALHHCFGAEMEWMRMDGEVAVTGTKENIFYCEKMTEKLLKNKKATCLSSSYRLETDDQIELHINSHFMPHAGNQFSLDTQFFFLPLYHPLPFFLHRGISGEGNLLHVMSAVHLTLHLHTPRTVVFYNERFEPLWRREPSLMFPQQKKFYDLTGSQKLV